LKILVTGSNGQLGSEFKLLSKSSLHHFVFVTRNELDISKKNSLDIFFKENTFDVILNCAAYTAVDRAEDEPDKAFAINRDAVKNLVSVCENHEIKLIHFSTDYVFDGSHSTPYKETDKVSPQSVYGLSKLAGENEIINSDISALIIRTSWLYSRFGNNFVKSMLRLGKTREHLSVVFDQIGTPTNALDLASATISCLSQINTWKNKQEVYHFSNEGVTSWYDFALEIFNTFGIDCKVKPLLSKDYPTKATRPHFSVLDKSKFKSDFNYEIKHWKETFQTLNI
jgi:dTDP-4-dehydrorhamnose reductase